MGQLNAKAINRAQAMIAAHEKEMKDLTPNERLINMLTDLKVHAYDTGLDWDEAQNASQVLAMMESRKDGKPAQTG